LVGGERRQFGDGDDGGRIIDGGRGGSGSDLTPHQPEEERGPPP